MYRNQEIFRYLILASQREGNRQLMKMLKGLDITPSQAEVLRLLQQEPFISLKDIGERLICETGSPSRLINTMVEKGLIISKVDNKDNRLRRYKLSSLGIEQAEKVNEVEKTIYQSLQKIYTEEEINTLNDLLFKYVSQTPLSGAFQKRGYIE
ncbi:MarR family transcriptional regulator [Salicibibacter cibarius]|uniref:MarR family transcriptional regulator n=1 Tax=Salicibibacter cibarius TaxID=2743000 RepID=A0A7T7CCL5_9BACI|nr:MarR family transcriptional regulator [Salicibibacter cibarius]QQK77030.1 MarR family transcriptional regulator [Salicibibacter cibarius]